MSTNSRSVKFDFTDDGSLNKLRTEYDKFASKVVQSGKNFGFNSNGNSNAQQNKYIKDEIEYYKQAYDYQKKIYDEKKKEYDLIQKQRQGNSTALNNGNIGQAAYDTRNKELDKKTKDLLSGTGKRKWDSYSKEQSSQLGDTQGYTTRLEHLLEGSNAVLRQILAQEKTDALRTIEAIEGDENATLEQKMAAGQARETLDGKKAKEKDEKSLLSTLFQFKTLDSLLKNGTGTLTANSGLEGAKSLIQTGKDAAISVMDIGADVAENFLGKKAGKIVSTLLRVGGRATGAFVDVSQDDLFSAYETRQDLDKVNFSNRALSGRSFDNYTLSKSGYSSLDFANANGGIARAMGTSGGSEGQTKNALLLEKGFGINQEISRSLLELTRSNKDTDRNLISIVGGIYNSGQNIFKGDRTYLGEFITKNFSTLQKDLQKNRSSVASGTVMDILSRFDSIGGQFGARNPNSMGLISSINGALMNPSGDSMDALTFAALRKSMPNSSIGDILREREKGLGSSKYLDATMGQLSQMGGGDDYQMMNLSKAFGINYNASTELIKAYKKNPNMFKNMSQKELSGYINNLGGMSEDNTNVTERQAASLTDAKIEGNFSKMSELISQISEVLHKSFDGATYTIDPASGKLTMSLGHATNTTKKPTNITPTTPPKKTTPVVDPFADLRNRPDGF